jgi:hypothetical protein
VVYFQNFVHIQIPFVHYITVDDTKIWNGMKPLTANSNWQTLESPLYGKAVAFGLQLEWLIVAESDNVVSLEVSYILNRPIVKSFLCCILLVFDFL